MLTVRIFLDGRQVDPSELPQITISNPTVDRVVNDIADRTVSSKAKESERSAATVPCISRNINDL